MLKGVRERDYLIIKRMLLLQAKGKENFLYWKDERNREDCLSRKKGEQLSYGKESCCCFPVQEGQKTEAQVSILTQRTQEKSISWRFLNLDIFIK